MKRLCLISLAAATTLAACASADPQAEPAGPSTEGDGVYSGPAILLSGDTASLDKLIEHLADAMGRAEIELGAGDPTITSSVSVLPPPGGPLEGRNVSTPEIFNLSLRDGVCYASRVSKCEEIELADVTCVPPPDRD
ncbi:MAG: hypothetical protein CMK07_15415 [Ponticaulis sp.]|nr:hypothetical protein [Ponticaulis sp.]